MIEKQMIEKCMTECTLCPRKCKVNRSEGQKGVCGQTDKVKVARAGLHMWEEPCISGTKGSGTVFFSGCSLHCVFCQNHNIANGDVGKEITVERLSEIFLELQENKANNINLVTAGHFVPQIVMALDMAKEKGLKLPVVYNTSAYESVETLKILDGYVDIYLPDLKYVDNKLSEKYSHASDYFDRAKEAIAEMVRQVGTMEFAEEMRVKENITTNTNGKKEGIDIGECQKSYELSNKIDLQEENMEEYEMSHEVPDKIKCKKESIDIEEYQRRGELGEELVMRKGVIVRHLLLPGCVEDSKNVLKYLLETYGNKVFISILNQYTPLPHIADYPELNRKVTEEEYEEVVDFAISRGIENGFVQEGEAAKESFIPEFDGEGV